MFLSWRRFLWYAFWPTYLNLAVSFTLRWPWGKKNNFSKQGQNRYISSRLFEWNTMVLKSFVYDYFVQMCSMLKIVNILVHFGDLWSLSYWPEVKSEVILQKEHSKSCRLLFGIFLWLYWFIHSLRRSGGMSNLAKVPNLSGIWPRRRWHLGPPNLHLT